MRSLCWPELELRNPGLKVPVCVKYLNPRPAATLSTDLRSPCLLRCRWERGPTSFCTLPRAGEHPKGWAEKTQSCWTLKLWVPEGNHSLKSREKKFSLCFWRFFKKLFYSLFPFFLFFFYLLYLDGFFHFLYLIL